MQTLFSSSLIFPLLSIISLFNNNSLSIFACPHYSQLEPIKYQYPDQVEMTDCDHLIQNKWIYSESLLTHKIYLVLAKYIHTKLIGASFRVVWQIYKKNTIIVYNFILSTCTNKMLLSYSDFGSSTHSHSVL